MILDKLQTEIKSDTTKPLSSFYMKILALNSKKPSSSCDQPSDDIIKWPLFNSPGKYSNVSQFTKHLYSMTLKGNTLFQVLKWLYAILFSFCQYLSTNKICPELKYLTA